MGSSEWGQKSPRPRFRSRPRWQSRTAIPRALDRRAQWAHSNKRLEEREKKIERDMAFIYGVERFIRWIATRLGLIKIFTPPPPPPGYKVEVGE